MRPYLHVYPSPHEETVIAVQHKFKDMTPQALGTLIGAGQGTAVDRSHLSGLLSVVMRENSVWTDVIIHV